MADNIVSIIIRARAQGVAATVMGVSGALSRVQERTAGLEMAQLRLAASSRQALMAGTALVGGMYLLARSAGEVGMQLRQVNTVAGLNESGLGRLRATIRGMAQDETTLADRMQITRGVYDVMSVKGYDAATATAVVGAAAVLATAGQEDLTGAVQSTMDVMTAYGRRAPADAKRVADELYKAVQIGRFRLPELRGEIGPPMAVAAQMGVDEKEIFAALTVMSNKGFMVSEAATAIERTMTSALKPTKEFTAAAQDLGYESTAAMVRQEGLAGALRLVEYATKGDEMAMAEIFPNIRALRGVLALGGESAADFAAALTDMQNSAGTAGRAAEEMQKDPWFQWQVSLKLLKEAGRDLGTELLPVLTDITHEVRDLVKAFNELSPEQKQNLLTLAKWGVALTVVSGGLGLVGSNILGVIRNVTQLRLLLGGGEAAGALAGMAGHAGHGAAGAAAGGVSGGGTAAAVAAETIAAVVSPGRKRRMGKVAAERARRAAMAASLDTADVNMGYDWQTFQRDPAAFRGAKESTARLFSRGRLIPRRLSGVIGGRGGGPVLDAADRRLRLAARFAQEQLPPVEFDRAGWLEEFEGARAARGGRIARVGTATGGAARGAGRLVVAEAGTATKGFRALAKESFLLNNAKLLERSSVVKAAKATEAWAVNSGGFIQGIKGLGPKALQAGAGLGSVAGSALATVGPLLAVAAAAAVAVWSVQRTAEVAQQWWEAKQQAAQGKKDLAAAEDTARQGGYVLASDVYKEMGYTQKQIDNGDISKQDQQAARDVMRERARNRTASGKSTSAQNAAQASEDQRARMMANMQAGRAGLDDGVTPIGSLGKGGAVPMQSFGGLQMPTGANVSVQRGAQQSTMSFNGNIVFSDRQQFMRFWNEMADKQFGRAS